MNSKEALEELIENAHEICEWELFRLKIIKQDLKVLEILKNYIDYYTYRDTDGQSCINLVIPESVMNYTIIKEWLENETNKQRY